MKLNHTGLGCLLKSTLLDANPQQSTSDRGSSCTVVIAQPAILHWTVEMQIKEMLSIKNLSED